MKIVIEINNHRYNMSDPKEDVYSLTNEQICEKARKFIRVVYQEDGHKDYKRLSIIEEECRELWESKIKELYSKITPNAKFILEKIVNMHWIDYVVYEVKEG